MKLTCILLKWPCLTDWQCSFDFVLGSDLWLMFGCDLICELNLSYEMLCRWVWSQSARLLVSFKRPRQTLIPIRMTWSPVNICRDQGIDISTDPISSFRAQLGNLVWCPISWQTWIFTIVWSSFIMFRWQALLTCRAQQFLAWWLADPPWLQWCWSLAVTWRLLECTLHCTMLLQIELSPTLPNPSQPTFAPFLVPNSSSGRWWWLVAISRLPFQWGVPWSESKVL